MLLMIVLSNPYAERMGDRLYRLDISENSLTIQGLAAMPLKLHESLKNEKILRGLGTNGTLSNHYKDGINYSVSNLK